MILSATSFGLTLAALAWASSQDEPSAGPDVSEEHLAAWNQAMERALDEDPEVTREGLAELTRLAATTDALEDDYLARRIVVERESRLSRNASPDDAMQHLQAQRKQIDQLEEWVWGQSRSMSPAFLSTCWSDLARKLQRLRRAMLGLGTAEGRKIADGGLKDDIELELKNAVEADPNSAVAEVGVARWLFADGETPLEDARAHLDAALALDPESPEALVLRACFWLVEGKDYLAEKDLRQAVNEGGLDAGLVLEDVAYLMEARGTVRQVVDLLLRAAEKTDSPGLWYLAISRDYARNASSLEATGGGEKVRLEEELARKFLAGIEHAIEVPVPSWRAHAYQIRAILQLRLAMRRDVIDSLTRYIELSGGGLGSWLVVQEILHAEPTLDPEGIRMRMEAVYKRANRDWPAAAVLADEYAKAGDLGMCKTLFLDALEGVAREGTGLLYVDDLIDRSLLIGELSKSEGEALLAYLDEAVSAEAALELGQPTSVRLEVKRRYEEAKRRLQELEAKARSYDPHMEAYMDIVEFLDAANRNRGGVPMTSWVDENLNIHTLVIGQQSLDF